MNSLNPQGIKTALDQRRKRDRERIRREEEAMDAAAVEVVQSLTAGLRGMVEDPTAVHLEPSSDSTPDETLAAAGAHARRAIEARRQRPASSRPAPGRGEPPLRAALRGIVADYAAPIRPSRRSVTELEALSGVALDASDTHGLWADLALAEVRAVRAAMRDLVQIVTDRAEAVIIAELLAAREHLALEYPDVPYPDPADESEEQS